MPAIPHQHDIEYPESDGQPFDSDLHRDEMFDLIGALTRRYRTCRHHLAISVKEEVRTP